MEILFEGRMEEKQHFHPLCDHFLFRAETAMMTRKAFPETTRSLRIRAHRHLHEIPRASSPTGRTSWYLSPSG